MPYGRKDKAMITDAYLQLDASNASIRAASTYTSQNTIDLSLARDIGSGEPLKVLYNVEVAFSGGTSVQPQIITSAAANLGSPTVIDSGPAPILTAALVLGAMFARFLPELTGVNGIGSTGQRYLGVQYVSVGTYTTGTISSRIIKDVQDVKFHASGYTIL